MQLKITDCKVLSLKKNPIYTVICYIKVYGGIQLRDLGLWVHR